VKAFTHYLGSNKENWRAYDASELVLTVGYNRPILIDQGTADPFLAEQLLPDVFERACDCWSATNLALPGGLNHSYYFITTLIENHIRHHAAALCDKFLQIRKSESRAQTHLASPKVILYL